MLVIGIFGSYQTAQAAEIVAGYGALEIIEGILLSFGISVFTADMVTTLTEDPSTAQDEYWRETQAAAWAEYMEAVYEDERKQGFGVGGNARIRRHLYDRQGEGRFGPLLALH